MSCGCRRCLDEGWTKNPELGLEGIITPSRQRFVVCAVCGNKRCPHATDHRNECTGSNEPGQKGSIYE